MAGKAIPQVIREWMHGRDSAKMIERDGKKYLERFYLWYFRNFGNRAPGEGFLHMFWMDDPDPLHDHPFDWGRIILWGRYREHYKDGTWTDCGPGHIVWRRGAEEPHRVELLSPYVVTLFWHWPRWRAWGFYHKNGWREVKEGRDGRPKVGCILPRKVGNAPKEVVHK